MRNLGITVALAAAAACPGAARAQADGTQPGTPPEADAAAEPARRAFTFALPLSYQGALLGDVLAEVSAEGVVRYDRRSLVERLADVLTESGSLQFSAALPPTAFVSEAEVAQAGVVVRYDSSRLEVHLERVEPALGRAQMLGDNGRFSQPPTTMEPKPFSAYLNVIGDFRLRDFEEVEKPAAILQGAVRYKGVVFEIDGGYDPILTDGGSSFYRRQARLVYDEPAQQRRWTAGDLQLLGLPITAGTLLGGVAVEKGRRIFSGSMPVIQLGGQQMLLDRDATVEVLVDGQVAERLQLNAGTYDLSQLMAQYGGREAQLFVTDVSGRRQLTSFDPFYDPSDLVAGEVEYGAALGFAPTSFRAQPVYGGKPAFSGYYRRGITNRLLLGGAVQGSERIQMAAAELGASPAILPVRFDLSGAVSTGEGTGFAVRSGVSVRGGSGTSARNLSMSVDYRSRNFATLSDMIGLQRSETLSFNANYSQSLGERTTLVVGGTWYERDRFAGTRLVFADVLHRASWFRLTAGVEYGDDLYGSRFGGRVSLTVPFGRNTRGEASYNSRREDVRLSLTRSYDDTVGSLGYDITALHSENFDAVEGSATYIGNRFYSRLTTSTSGPGLSRIDDRQETRLQVGTSIAAVGDSFAIGRPITDSFLIARPHSGLEGKQVVVGQSLEHGRVDAKSDFLGPALQGRLNSYSRQSVVYDLEGGAEGHDIGTGIETVYPPYKSGYLLTVGSDANVTAFGFLSMGGEPASLLAGIISSLDDTEFQEQPFFTNSVGRFAAQGLRPGKTYRVLLNGQSLEFFIKVPLDSEPLLRMGEVAMPASGQKEE